MHYMMQHGRCAKYRANPLISLARSERFELPTLGIEIRCSIQLSYERLRRLDELASVVAAAGQLVRQTSSHLAAYFSSLSGRAFRSAFSCSFFLRPFLPAFSCSFAV